MVPPTVTWLSTGLGIFALFAIQAARRRCRRTCTKSRVTQDFVLKQAISLEMLKEDVLRQIWRHLPVRDAACLGTCSVALREVDRSLREGQHLLWLPPRVSVALSDKRQLYNVHKESFTVTKNWRPGTGHVAGREPVDAYSTFFQVCLESYNGRRCEIGVCAKSAITSQGLDKSRAWYFDCWGRKVHNHVQQEYGGKMSAGDVVGVFYNKLQKSLSFFENGRNMGVAFENVAALAGSLVPFVSIPFWEGEEVRFLRHPVNVHLPLTVEEMSVAGKYEPRIHPDDNKILVKTFLNEVYLVSADPTITTVMQLKETLAPMCGYPAAHLALRISGKQLVDPLALLSDVGLVFGANGSHTEEVLMYVPHEVS